MRLSLLRVQFRRAEELAFCANNADLELDEFADPVHDEDPLAWFGATDLASHRG